MTKVYSFDVNGETINCRLDTESNFFLLKAKHDDFYKIMNAGSEKIKKYIVDTFKTDDYREAIVLLTSSLTNHYMPVYGYFGRLQFLSYLEDRGVVSPTIFCDPAPFEAINAWNILRLLNSRVLDYFCRPDNPFYEQQLHLYRYAPHLFYDMVLRQMYSDKNALRADIIKLHDELCVYCGENASRDNIEEAIGANQYGILEVAGFIEKEDDN